MYKLNNMLAFKNIPVSSNYWNSPNYDSDSYDVLQIKAAHRNEFLIPLKADGDGSGVATIYLQSTEDQTINITGAGRFYTDAQGTTGESTSAVVGTSLTPLYVKLNEGSCYLVLTKADKLLGLGSTSVNVITEATNAPFIDGCNIGYKLHNVEYIKLTSNTKSFFTGSIDNCPSLSYINIAGNLLTVFTGTIDNCPNLSYFVIGGNTLSVITGSIDSCPNLTTISIASNLLCVITGSIDSCPNLTYFNINGNTLSVISGDIGKAILCNYLNFNENESPLTYVIRRSDWTSSLRLIFISSASMTTEMLDNLFIDVDSSGVLPANEKLINVSGLCAPVSDASAAARASLVSKGFTIVVNT